MNTSKNQSIAVKTGVKAGSLTTNHNEALAVKKMFPTERTDDHQI